MKKSFEHNNFSKNWYNIWEQNSAFEPNYKKNKTYCITLPPPNITGKLHMGHAFQCTLMDMLIRYYRMKNYSTLWKTGTDHAGIATQILIEQKIKNNADPLKTALNWKKKSIKNIQNQLKMLGCSLNWKTERFTLDKHFSYAVKKAFITLYQENLIYKCKKLVNWDPKLKTAISDLETIYKDENTKLYYIKYQKNNLTITIATSRPETIFADAAIAINPNDKRYKHLQNATINIPLINKTIPIIYDTNVDPTFGTGCLKITPAHDFKDFEINEKHNLPIINILTTDGKLNTNVPKKYQNLDINSARKLVVTDLTKLNLIEKIETYKNKIPRGDRSNEIIEPLITDQWYVKTQPLITPVYDAIKNNKLKITPHKWKKTFFNWINNIKDWCISRQIWWGHKIPIWYDEKNTLYAGYNEKYIRNFYNINKNIELKQDTDVLDTWFSSALWPFASLGWPNNTKEFKKFYPTTTLITGFDIIFFWAIRMLMFGIKFTKTLPFKEIYIHGLIRDQFGHKMSKTKGNVLDPADIINGITYKDLIIKRTSDLLNNKTKDLIIANTNKQFPEGIKSFGVDALRLTFCSLATDNISLNLDFEKIEKYKNFCNKLWNATNYIITHKQLQKNHKEQKKISLYDTWILHSWQKTKKNIQIDIKKRNFSHVSEEIYKFVWNDFCNWYIELTKILMNSRKYEKHTKRTLILIIKEILKILHPIAPYITEELWYKINNKNKQLITSTYPKTHKEKTNTIILTHLSRLKNICTSIRNIKIDSQNNTQKSINIYVKDLSNLKTIENIKTLLTKLTKTNKLYLNKLNKTHSMLKFSEKIILTIPPSKKTIKIESTYNTKEKLIKIKNQINSLIHTLNNDTFKEKATVAIIKNKEEKLKNLLDKYNAIIKTKPF